MNMDQQHLMVAVLFWGILCFVIGWVLNTTIKSYKEYRIKKSDNDHYMQRLKENNAADMKKAEEETKRYAIYADMTANRSHLENNE